MPFCLTYNEECRRPAEKHLLFSGNVILTGVLITSLAWSSFFVFIWCCCVWLGRDVELIFHLHVYANMWSEEVGKEKCSCKAGWFRLGVGNHC